MGADSCIQAFHLLNFYGLNCTIDLSVTGILLGGDGSLQSLCPQQCGLCPQQDNFTISFDVHNEAECTARQNSCVGQVTFPPVDADIVSGTTAIPQECYDAGCTDVMLHNDVCNGNCNNKVCEYDLGACATFCTDVCLFLL